MNGWVGKILRVDLTRDDCSAEDLDPDLAKDFIGGRGLGVKLLFDEIDPKIDPLSPENRLVFATGPLTGTRAITGARYMVVTKSPLTGAIACSNAGGYFGPELKFAGYDLIIFEGKSPEPVYLSIMDDEVEIKPAQHLWGKSTVETEAMIRSQIGDNRKARDTQITCIGPAGENLVRVACIRHDGRAFGRSGTGAVMGSKNLKAVAVRGTKGITVANEDGLKKARAAFLDKFKPSEVFESPTYGSWDVIVMAKAQGAIATRNFQAGSFEEISGIDERLLFRKELFVKSTTCSKCPYACGRETRLTTPEFQGEGEGPEHETYVMLGPNCGTGNFAAITKASYLCNELGMDTIGVGATLSCAMELYQKGFLPEKDAGYQLNFGNIKAMIELIQKMALRQGFGDVLAEGGYRLAERYGHPELFMGVKKQEMPAHHAQGIQGLGLAYATSNSGCNHTKGFIRYDEHRTETAGQAARTKADQDFVAVIDASGLCWNRFFNPFVWLAEETLTMLEAATGAGYTEESMLLAGERIWNLERLFNLKAGFIAENDTLPKRILEEPLLKTGPSAGQVVRLGEMLPEYYELRGWDKNGIPTPAKLTQLGLTKEGSFLWQG